MNGRERVKSDDIVSTKIVFTRPLKLLCACQAPSEDNPDLMIEKVWNDLDNEFYDNPEDIEEMILNYIEKNLAAFAF